MTNEIQVFNFNSRPVRTDIKEGQPWLCLRDVCSILRLDNVSYIKQRLNPKGIVQNYVLTKGGKQKAYFVNEANLYRLILRSDKPQAREFENWVCEEVLPSIRKTGSYGVVAQPTQIDMRAISGMVKKCTAVAVKQAIAEMFATPLEIDDNDPLQKHLYNISDKDMMDTFRDWYVGKNYKLHKSLWEGVKTIEQLESKLGMVEKALKS